jgi:hypothetical protein
MYTSYVGADVKLHVTHLSILSLLVSQWPHHQHSHQYEPKSLSIKSEICRLYSPRVLSSIIFILSCSFLLICNPSDIIPFSPRHIGLVEFVTLHFNMTSLPISVYSVTSSWTLPWMVPKIRRTIFNVLLFL